MLGSRSRYNDHAHKPGQENAEERAADNLNGPVAQLFGQVTVFSVAKLLLDLVDLPRMNAGSLADAHGVIHHNGGQDHGEGKRGGTDSLAECGRGGQSAHGGGVGTRHAARFPEPFEAEFTGTDRIENGFENLCKKPGQDGGGKQRVNAQ